MFARLRTLASAPLAEQRAQPTAKRRWLRRFLWLGLLMSAAGCVLGIQIWTYDGRFTATSPVDVAIVLGSSSYGGVPSPVFAGRLDYAHELLQTGAVRYIVVTGGSRTNPRGPESAAGVRYLLARGDPADRVLSEGRSLSTPENLCFALEVVAPLGVHSYAIVSDPLHLRRALRYARDLGMAARPAATPYTRYRRFGPRVQFLLRETSKYAKRLVMGPIRCGPALEN